MYSSSLVISLAIAGIPKSKNIEDEGGNAIPNPELPATIVVAMLSDQPVFFIHGIVIDPTAAALPEPGPEIIPNKALAIVDT